MEEVRHRAEQPPRQQLEGGVRALVGIAHRLARLHLVEQLRHARIVAPDRHAQPLQLVEQVRLAGLVGDQHAAAVADAFRLHVLVGGRLLEDGRRMDAGLGGERRLADVGRLPVRRAVQDLVEHAARMRQLPELLGPDLHLEALGELRLQQQRRDQRGEVGIAAALAQAIERALDLPRAGPHRRQRIGDRVLGVVVRVDAEMRARHVLRHLGDDLAHLVRQRAAVGVAQHHPARARLVGGRRHGQRVVAVGLVAVEEMLAVDHGFAAGPSTTASTDCATPSTFSSLLMPSATRT